MKGYKVIIYENGVEKETILFNSKVSKDFVIGYCAALEKNNRLISLMDLSTMLCIAIF